MQKLAGPSETAINRFIIPCGCELGFVERQMPGGIQRQAGRSQGVWPEVVIPLGHVGTPISHRNCQFRSAGAETWNKTHPNSSSSSTE